jgi:hypothetical protein
MRLRLAAAVLLVPLALGGCDRNPIGAGAPLLGGWESDEVPFVGTAPNGSTDLLYKEFWAFNDDGASSRTTWLIDAPTRHTWVLLAEDGSWTATDDELRRTVRYAFYADQPAHAHEAPTAVPVAPPVQRYGYDRQGSTLRIIPPCPQGASCTAPLPLHPAPEIY